MNNSYHNLLRILFTKPNTKKVGCNMPAEISNLLFHPISKTLLWPTSLRYNFPPKRQEEIPWLRQVLQKWVTSWSLHLFFPPIICWGWGLCWSMPAGPAGDSFPRRGRQRLSRPLAPLSCQQTSRVNFVFGSTRVYSGHVLSSTF